MSSGMGNGVQKNIKKKQSLRYVTAYVQIEDMIKSGKFKPGDQLPVENELAVQLGVSRGTLRQALQLLREDGAIYNHQGKGNFVTSHNSKEQSGIEKVHNNPVNFATVPIETVLLDVEYRPASKKMVEFLELDQVTLLTQFRVMYKHGEDIVALRHYFMAYDYISRHKVDLDDKEKMLEFISEYIDEYINSSRLTINCVEARESVAEPMNRLPGTPLLYFAEQMRTASGEVAIYAKSYYDTNYFDFSIMRE